MQRSSENSLKSREQQLQGMPCILRTVIPGQSHRERVMRLAEATDEQ